MDSKTFTSTMWRVNIKVFDLRGPFAPKNTEPLKFAVHLLPNTAHKSTAFSTGRLLYYGPSLREAVLEARQFTPSAGIPKQWEKYQHENQIAL